MDVTKERLVEMVRLLATPIDFDRLIKDGVLKEPHGGWYEVIDMKRLPEHALEQVSEFKNGSFTDHTPPRNYFKFRQGGSAAAKLYEQHTGKPFCA